MKLNIDLETLRKTLFVLEMAKNRLKDDEEFQSSCLEMRNELLMLLTEKSLSEKSYK